MNQDYLRHRHTPIIDSNSNSNEGSTAVDDIKVHVNHYSDNKNDNNNTNDNTKNLFSTSTTYHPILNTHHRNNKNSPNTSLLYHHPVSIHQCNYCRTEYKLKDKR